MDSENTSGELSNDPDINDLFDVYLSMQSGSFSVDEPTYVQMVPCGQLDNATLKEDGIFYEIIQLYDNALCPNEVSTKGEMVDIQYYGQMGTNLFVVAKEDFTTEEYNSSYSGAYI
jgi:lipase chaperone LimK